MMRQRTQLINALREHLAELGIVAAMGDKEVAELLTIVADERDDRLAAEARAILCLPAAPLRALQVLSLGRFRQSRLRGMSRRCHRLQTGAGPGWRAGRNHPQFREK